MKISSLLPSKSINGNTFDKRMLSYKSNKWKCKYSAENKMKRLQSNQRTKRQSLINSKRNGFGASNLGIVLRITDELISDFEMDPCQNIPSLLCESQSLTECDFSALTISNGQIIDSSWSANILDRAEEMVKSIFLEFDVVLDLSHTKKDLFTADILYDKKSDIIVAVMEFVQMQKYLWVESLCVNQQFRKRGVGKFLIRRLLDIARANKKSLLLYSLFDSVKFYLSVGFNFSAAFPYQEGHHGVFLVLNPFY